MKMEERAKVVPHLFMPGDTVSGVLKKVNRHDTTPEEVSLLIKQFKEINGEINPKPGMRFLIPVLTRHEALVFSL